MRTAANSVQWNKTAFQLRVGEVHWRGGFGRGHYIVTWNMDIDNLAKILKLTVNQ